VASRGKTRQRVNSAVQLVSFTANLKMGSISQNHTIPSSNKNYHSSPMAFCFERISLNVFLANILSMLLKIYITANVSFGLA
jgi:hypothetical protein